MRWDILIGVLREIRFPVYNVYSYRYTIDNIENSRDNGCIYASLKDAYTICF